MVDAEVYHQRVTADRIYMVDPPGSRDDSPSRRGWHVGEQRRGLRPLLPLPADQGANCQVQRASPAPSAHWRRGGAGLTHGMAHPPAVWARSLWESL